MTARFGLVVACARRDELLQRAWTGDEKAQAIIDQLLPRDLPASELIRQRDEQLCEIGRWLIGSGAVKSHRHLARVLFEAWKRLSRPHGEITDAEPFQRLAADERATLTIEIRKMLSWSPKMVEDAPSFSTVRNSIQDVSWPTLPPLKLASDVRPAHDELHEVSEREWS